MPRLRVAACQINTVVGDLDGNVRCILAALERAEAAGCDVAVFPELAITGYPPEDLLLKPGFVADNRAALDKLAARTGRCAAVVGFVDAGRDLYNAAAVCADGEVQGVYRKRILPNYSVFDEQRYFAPGYGDPQLFVIGGVRVGVSICEDAWAPDGPIAEQAAGGAELILNLNASPYYAGRLAERERMLATRAADASCALVYVNLVGGQDELVFDGASLVLDADGKVLARARQFGEGNLIADVDIRPVFRKRLLDPRGRATARPLPEVLVSAEPRANDNVSAPPIADPLSPVEEVYEALVLGTRDYVRKNGFTDAVHRAVGRGRLVAGRCRRGRRPGRRSRARGVHAVAVLQRGVALRRPGSWPRPWASSSAPSPSSRPTLRSSRCWRRRSPSVDEDLTEENIQARVRGTTAHGAVQQVRLDGAGHRQQERDGGRVLHALRRPGRRVRRHQGRLQAAGLRPVPQPQRAGPGRR